MTSVADVFGASGLLSQRFPGYEPRAGQVAMAEAVERNLATGGHVLVDAPTGVGKSLAYLAPAVDHALRTKTKVIVVTGNIALQEQLVGKDLPTLAEILPDRFKFALMKGRNNYLCVSSLEKALAEGLLQRDPHVRKAFEWAQRTETGDSSEFDDGFPPGVWKRLSVASDECKGRQCQFHGKCFAERAKREAEAATIIVTNYHLFFAHLVLRAKMREGAVPGSVIDVILPPASAVIFDEAHKAADIARDFLGFTLSLAQVEWLVKGFNHELGAQTMALAHQFFAEASALKKDRRYSARIRRGQELRVGMPLARRLAEVSKFYMDAVTTTAWSDDERAELLMRSKRGATLAEQFAMVAELRDDKEIVYFLEETERAIYVKSKPIDVAPFLREELFGEYKTVVLASATLATTKGSGAFSFVKKEVGLDTATEVLTESPFDWAKQCMLVLPKTMRRVDPTDREMFPRAVAAHVADACSQADGRTLGLFTSYRTLEASREALGGFRHRVFTQKDGPKQKVVERFKADVHSCLLGSESFWAGIDAPGETLSCVVIDRLPFPTPDDAVVSAISERNDRWFFEYAIPRAIIQIRQGFGRLIRAKGDRGVVVILDPRMVTKGYGSSVIKALPPGMRMGDEVQDIGRFLAASGGTA